MLFWSFRTSKCLLSEEFENSVFETISFRYSTIHFQLFACSYVAKEKKSMS